MKFDFSRSAAVLETKLLSESCSSSLGGVADVGAFGDAVSTCTPSLPHSQGFGSGHFGHSGQAFAACAILKKDDVDSVQDDDEHDDAVLVDDEDNGMEMDMSFED
jgi:hypothetical protein